LSGRRWTTAVVKPAVSANAHRTEVLTADAPAAFEARLSALAARLDADVLAQELVSEIQTDGEYSMIFFDDAFSHAVLKRPAPGEFRVQEQFGGANTRVRVDPRLERAARGVLEALPERPVYARLDLVPRGDGFLLMEVELIEPTLFLALDPQAPERFARAILARVAAAR
jgi:glutathione synthase/RimK-type ligase-like ATP-grasp enzyme